MHTKISSVNLNRKGHLVDLDIIQIVHSKMEEGSKEKKIIGLSSLRCLVILDRRARERSGTRNKEERDRKRNNSSSKETKIIKKNKEYVEAWSK